MNFRNDGKRRDVLSDTQYRILLIEDNPGDAKLVEIFLEESSFRDCDIVNKVTLSEGMKELENDSNFGVVLLDLSLPDSLGISTLERLIKRFPDANVIVLTGDSDREMGIKAVDMGAQDYLVKGDYDSARLSQSLHYSIRRHVVLKRLEEAQQIAHIGNWKYDLKTKKFIISAEVYRILGYKPNEIELTIDVVNAHAVEKDITIAELIKSKLLIESNDTYDFWIRTKNQELRYLSLRGQLIYDQNGIIEAKGIVQDITERKQAQELLKEKEVAAHTIKMKEQFLANISHEMRTPMNAILGMTNLVLKTPINEEQHGYMKSIKQSSEHLLGIINDILEISTFQFGEVTFDRKEFDILEVLRNQVSIVEYKTKEKGIDLVLDINDNVPTVVFGDPLRLSQIITNLVANSVKFTDKGYVKIKVKKTKETKDKITLNFDIIDTGIGMAKDKLDVIFTTFTQISHDSKKKYEGTGLGLAIVKQLIDLQNGKIKVDSQVGVGSIFTVELTFGKASGNIVAPPKEDKIILDSNRVVQVLLVEDHPLNQIVATKTLEKEWNNVKVTVAGNGKIALDKLREKDFDIILMDIQMPIMDGYEATQYIREQFAFPKSKTPILAMTAHAHIAQNEKYKEHGMDDFVLKPFVPQQFFAKVAKYVNK